MVPVVDEKKNRQSWLDAGLQTLAAQGPQGLRIMPIAQQLGVTKGSFYWHFKSLEEYQLALLEEWEHSHTEHVIEQVESTGGDSLAKLRALFVSTISSDFSLSRAIRSWSLADANAREVQARVDAKRVSYVAKLLRGLGWSKQQALTLGHWVHWAAVGKTWLGRSTATQAQVDLIVATLRPLGLGSDS